MKILNLYCGIGGNRKLWGDEHEITAVELNPEIAKIYQDFFPNDTVIVADAHEYLLNNYPEFDFIWSSPPCQTHSRLNTVLRDRKKGNIMARYIDISLYQEIVLLQHWFNGKFVVENVIPYYEPLVTPTITLGRHNFWCNFNIKCFNIKETVIETNKKNVRGLKHIMSKKNIYVENWHNYRGDKRTLINNCVNPQLGLHIISCADNTEETINQLELFNQKEDKQNAM